MKEGIQKISAIIFEWISKANNKQTERHENNDKNANVLNIIARLLLIHLEIKAVIVPANAETRAIIDKITADECSSI